MIDLPSYPVHAAPLWVDAMAAAAGSVGVLSQWPQAWRLWRTGRYAGLSTLSCILNLLTPATWFAYGLSQLSGVQILVNGLALIGAAAVMLGLVVRGGLRLLAWLPAVALGLAVVTAVTVFGGTGPSGALATTVTLSMALPQVWLLLRGRFRGGLDASGISLARWGLIALCNIGWLSYGVLVTDPAITLTASVMVLSSAAVLVLAVTVRPALHVVPDVGAAVGAGAAVPPDRIACSP
jgi:uncharacterized protein with PQ loop repeat